MNMKHSNEHLIDLNPGASSEPLATAIQVAKRLGVSERWVRDHATRRSPKLPVVKLGSLLRFRQEDVDAFIARQRSDHSGTSRIQ
jgi:excisionase family DNA binding protein